MNAAKSQRQPGAIYTVLPHRDEACSTAFAGLSAFNTGDLILFGNCHVQSNHHWRLLGAR